MTRGPGPLGQRLDCCSRRGEEARRFAPRAAVRLLRTRRPSHQPYDLWGRVPRHRLGAPVCFGGDFSWPFGARAEESAFKKGFIPRVAAMPSLLSHSLCPFTSELSALRRRSSPWPCKFILSTFRLSGCLTWRAACLDGARRHLVEGSVSAPSPSAILPLGSSRSLFLARWRYRSRLLLAVAGGARPRGGWRSSASAQFQGCSSASRATVSHQWSSTRMTTSLVVVGSEPGCGLPLVLSFKDVHQPCRGGERAELWFRLPHELVARFFLQHSEERMFTSLAKEANFGYVVPAGPQAPSAAELPTPWLGWSCHHPRRGARARASSPWRTC
jgi:hypothetical protein